MPDQLKDKPTDIENTQWEELFLAIYFNDLEKVIEFKNRFPELYAKRDKFPITKYTTFDLTNLTFFNQSIWFDSNWVETIMPLVEKHRQRTEIMKAFWLSESGQQETHRPFEYNHYHEHFFCKDPYDDDEMFLNPISFYLEKGFSAIDITLYNRAISFDFSAVEKLLEQGANANIHFDNDGHSSTYSRISTEVSFLATCEVIPTFREFETLAYDQTFDIEQMFGDLLGLAAHQKMYNLLKKYGEEV